MGIEGKGGLGSSSNGKEAFDDIDMEMLWDDEDMESDDDADIMDMDLHDLGEASLMNFCKKAAAAFFKQHGLISHQINSTTTLFVMVFRKCLTPLVRLQ